LRRVPGLRTPQTRSLQRTPRWETGDRALARSYTVGTYVTETSSPSGSLDMCDRRRTVAMKKSPLVAKWRSPLVAR
jgi:hypothetical protein